MNRIIKNSIISSIFILAAIPLQAERTFKGFMWFDLGNTVVDTRDGFDKIRYIKGFMNYKRQLIAKGYKIGLITNIPEDWGLPDHRPSKLKALQDLIQKGWIGKTPFRLSDFDHVIIPHFDVDRKPAAKLYIEAKKFSHKYFRIPFYQGESRDEIEASRKNGIRAFLVRLTKHKTHYYPAKQLPFSN